MSKVAAKPPVPTRSPIKSSPVKLPTPRPATATTKPTAAKPIDTVKTSAEAKTADKPSSSVNSLLAGMQDWGGSASPDKAGQTKPPTEPMTLDKGQFLKKGAKGEKVKQLQELLNSKGAQLDPDGKFGPKTLAALKKFQGDSEIGTDGIVGPKTLAALNGPAADNKGAQSVGDQAGAQKTDQKAPVAKADQTKTADTAGGKKFGNTREALDKLPGPLKKYADHFQKMGEKYGVDPRFLASISMHETANGKSSAFRNKNNAMGISNKRGPIHVSSVEASIEQMARGLAKPTGYYKNKTTIGQIGKVYAPVGAANDPTGLNGYWAKGVASNFRKFGGNPSQQVIFR